MPQRALSGKGGFGGAPLIKCQNSPTASSSGYRGKPLGGGFPYKKDGGFVENSEKNP